MKHAELNQITKLYFGYEEVARVLRIRPESARVSASRYVRQGLLLRLKRNLYVRKDRWESLDREEVLELANLLQVPSYVSLMTALDIHQVTTQMQRAFIESIVLHRTREMEIGDTIFHFTQITGRLYFGFRKENGVFIATPEKAILDASYLMSLGRYRFDIASIDADRLNRTELRKMSKRFPERTRELLGKYGYPEVA